MPLGINSVLKSYVAKQVGAATKKYANTVKISALGIIGLGIVFTFANRPSSPGHSASNIAVSLLAIETSTGSTTGNGTGAQVITGITTDGSLFTVSGSLIFGDLASPTCVINHDGTTTGCSFGSGGSGSFGTGNVLTIGNARFVKKQGDTMTGALSINVTNGNLNTLGLKVLNTASGAMVHGEKGLTSSGNLVWESAGSGATLVVSGQFSGAGLADCDDPTGSKLLWDTTTKRFSCGTDQSGVGTTYTAGQGLTIASNSFKVNGTLTGSLVRFTTLSGSSVFAKTTLSTSGALKVLGDMSGSTLHTNLNASISGSLLVENTVTGSSLQGFGLASCSNGVTSKLLWSAGKFSCGTDTDTDTNTTYTAGQGLTLTSTSFKVNATLTGSLARFTTMSGETLFAHTRLTSSGGLKVLGDMSGSTLHVNGMASLSGALTVQGNARIKGNGNVVGTLSGAALTIMGGNSYFLGSLRLGDSAAPKAKLDVVGTVSGSSLVINGTTKIATHTYTWPTTQGTASQVLQNNGSDTLSWATIAGVTSFFGDGNDGAVTWSANTSLDPSTEKRYTTATLNSSTTLNVSSSNTLLVIHATGNTTINGTINLTGSGAAGGAGGARCTTSVCTATVGNAGTAGNTLVSGWTVGTGGGGGVKTNGGEGGGGGGGASAIVAGTVGTAGASSGGTGGAGGTTISANQLAFLSNLLRGSGCGAGGAGGGGGGRDGGTTANSFNGGTGGAGGGCMVMLVGGNLTLGASSIIKADGKAGVADSGGSDGYHGGAGGGGGGGTIIVLVGGTITDNGVTLSAAGGSGGSSGGSGNGGAGAAGRIIIYSLSTGTFISA